VYGKVNYQPTNNKLLNMQQATIIYLNLTETELKPNKKKQTKKTKTKNKIIIKQ
jgi:hypothetical protein